MARIVIGWANSRSQGQIFEQQIKGHGIPALLDLGLFAVGHAESQLLEIFLDDTCLTSEVSDTIASILGPNANHKLLARFREKTMTPVEEISWVSVGWFDAICEAENACELLRIDGVYSEIEDEDGVVGVYVVERTLSTESVAKIARVLGENADAEVLAEYASLLSDRKQSDEFCLVRTEVDNVADWAVETLEPIGLLAYAVPVDDEIIEVRCPSDSISVETATRACETLGDYSSPELMALAGKSV